MSVAAAEPLVVAIEESGTFTRPTFSRFISLMSSLILTMGRHTVSRALAVMAPRIEGHWCNYHRVFSWAKYSLWGVAAVIVRQVVGLLPDGSVIELVADDTVDGKAGDRVWAKSAHRDSTRSDGSQTVIKYGHKWLALCVLVRLKGWDRPWALPILCGLCLPKKPAAKLGKRPKTAAQITRQMLVYLMRLMPRRKFILTGDHHVVTHQTADFAHRHCDRVSVIGRLRGDANLYAPPKNPHARSRTGGPRRKGRKLPPPARRMTRLKPVSADVVWYGGGRRKLRYVSEQALWYGKHDNAVTPIRWVGVCGDQKQDLEDAFFFCSDVEMAPQKIVEHYARRWNIEVTFEEARALLGLETTRHWCKRSVLRVTPLLLGLFTAVTLIWSKLPTARQLVLASQTPCYRKSAATFGDALAAVRRAIWEQRLMRHEPKTRCLNHISRPVRQLLLWHLSAAA